MTKLEGVKFAVNKSELEKSNTLASQEEVNNARPKQRLVKLIEDCAVEPTEETTEDMPQVQLRFLLLPQKITVSLLSVLSLLPLLLLCLIYEIDFHCFSYKFPLDAS